MSFSELLASRTASVISLESLVEQVREIVAVIEDLGGPEFQLFAYSPAHRLIEVKPKLEALVMTSQIEWNHGREPDDPTYELIFFNHPERFQQSVFIRAAFLLQSDDGTCPGVEVSLTLGDDLGVDLVGLVVALAGAFDVDDITIQASR